MKADPPRPRLPVPATAPPVPARVLPRPEPASRTVVQAPRPRPAAPATAPAVPTSDLPTPAAGPRVVVDPPTPRPVVLPQAALVPAGKLPEPEANPTVEVRAPRPETASPVLTPTMVVHPVTRPGAAPPVKADPPRPRSPVPATAPPVSARDSPTPRPAGRMRVNEPTRRPATPTHTTSAPAHSVQAPPQDPSHPTRPPRGQDAAAADALERLEAARLDELARRKQRLIAEAEADWRKSAGLVLRRDVPGIARALAARSLKRGGGVSSADLYYAPRSQYQNACRCDESAKAAARVLSPVLLAIAEKHYSGRHPPAVRDRWWHRSGDEYTRDKAIAAAMAEWESVSAETIERMVEAAIPGDVRHLRDGLGGQQRLDAKIRALTASPQPQHERSRDRGPGYGY